MSQIKTLKNGAYVTWERTPFSGYYVIRAYSPSGKLLDRIVVDDYRMAIEYRRAFGALAKAS